MTIDKLNKKIEAVLKESEFKEKSLVFGEGPAKAKIVVIGEAPGADEEKQGKPFVGKAGKNLTELLDNIGLSRNDIYITNTVKLRPTKLSPKTGKPLNRTPNSKEIEFFKPFLFEELEIIGAKYIVTLGNVPLNAVSKDKLIIGDCHGRIIDTGFYNNVFALYHPAAIIYNQSLKDTYLDDMKSLRTILNNED